jgi:hypothetical protein
MLVVQETPHGFKAFYDHRPTLVAYATDKLEAVCTLNRFLRQLLGGL